MTKNGIAGQLLRVNLTTKTITNEELPLEMFIEYLGGRGLGAFYLDKEVGSKTDGLSSENKLIFFN